MPIFSAVNETAQRFWLSKNNRKIGIISKKRSETKNISERKVENKMKIKIYQIDMDRDLHRVKFQGYEEMQKYQESADIDASIYDRVFMGDVDRAL